MTEHNLVEYQAVVEPHELQPGDVVVNVMPASLILKQAVRVTRKRPAVLPTVPHTVIRCFYDGVETVRLLGEDGTWQGQSVEYVRAGLLDFEVLSRPVGRVLSEDEDEYFDRDDMAAERQKGFQEGAKVAIDRLQKLRGLKYGDPDIQTVRDEFRIDS